MSKAHESPLMRIIEVASALGAATVADEAFELADRIAEGQFFCACVGQFKRGKSTFLNALMGEAVLPVGVLPVTAAITVIKYGRKRGARVRLLDGNSISITISELAEYVTEEQNPENKKGVVAVEVFWPNALLETGLCLVDTPGVGSVFDWNTAVTEQFVPNIDAALVVIGADPPLSKDELGLIDHVSQQTSTLLFALNKADKLTDNEQEQAAEFARKVLSQRLKLTDIPIYRVSASERLWRSEPTRQWAQLEADLMKLAWGAGKAMVAAAEERGEERMVRALRAEIDERVQSLQRPMGESQQRLEALQQEVAAAETELGKAIAECADDLAHLREELDRRRETLVQELLGPAEVELGTQLRNAGLRPSLLRETGQTFAQAIGVERTNQMVAAMKAHVERRYRESSALLAAHAQEIVRRLSPSAIAGIKDLPRAVEPKNGFTAQPDFSQVVLPPPASASALKLAGEVFRAEAAFRAVAEELAAYLKRLLDAGSAVTVAQLKQQVSESEARLSDQLRRRLTEVAAVAKRALSRATERQRQGAESVRAEIERLQYLREKLARL